MNLMEKVENLLNTSALPQQFETSNESSNEVEEAPNTYES